MTDNEKETLSQHIAQLLCEFCEDAVILPDTELDESGLLDSLAFMQLLSALEDEGYCIQPTQYEKSRFSTARKIADICAELQADDYPPAR